MAQLIHFEERAVTRLRERLGAVEEANRDLIAFARGHSGAVASIHAAALVAVEATSIEALIEIVTRRWPAILGIDAVALALVVGRRGFRAGGLGIETIESAFVERIRRKTAPVEVRRVATGHPLFGTELAEQIRSEAMIRIDAEAPFPRGLLLLGQTAELEVDAGHGSELLLFLGRIVAASMRRSVAGS